MGPMSTTLDLDPSRHRSAFWLLTSLLGLVLALTVTLVVSWLQTALITDAAQLGSVTFGWPFGWITQDLSSLNPPLPYRLSMGSPFQFPVREFRVLALLANLALVWVPFVALAQVVRRSNQRRTADRTAGE